MGARQPEPSRTIPLGACLELHRGGVSVGLLDRSGMKFEFENDRRNGEIVA